MLIRETSVPKNGNETEETGKVPFLVAKRIQGRNSGRGLQAWRPPRGGRTGGKVQSQPVARPRSVACPGKRGHGRYEPVQGSDRKTFIRCRSLGHCRTQVGRHLS